MIRIPHAATAGCLAAALAAGAVPAQADTVAAATASAVASRTAGEPQDARARQRADEERLICARIELPARRVRPRICRTRAQWENMGGLPTH